MKEQVHVVIDSRFRISGTSSSFNYELAETIDRIEAARIEFVTIPFTYYCFSTSNNVLVLNGTHPVTITPGNYNATSLAAELQTELGNPGAPLNGQNPTVTFSFTTMKFTIQATSNFIVNAKSSVPTSTAAPFLGFTVNTASSSVATSDSAANLSGPNYIRVESAFLMGYVSHKQAFVDTSYNNTFVIIPVNASPGGIITYTPHNYTITYNGSEKRTISPGQVIDISLKDEYGNAVNLNGADWCMHFAFLTY